MVDAGSATRRAVRYVAEQALSKLPRVAAPVLKSTMIRLMDAAIDGVGKLPGAKHTASRALQRKGIIDGAVTAIIKQHCAMAAAQGVISNLGGIVSAIVGTPINVTGLIVVQIRMVACIAHLQGYDINDPRVRTAMAMCLLGERELNRQIADRRLPTTPLAVATSPVHDPELHVQVAERVLTNILTEATGKGLITTIGRKTPIIGGGVGGVADWLDTVLVSRCARRHLVTRRPLAPIHQYAQPGVRDSSHQHENPAHHQQSPYAEQPAYTPDPG